jgi:hypothetical protein
MLSYSFGKKANQGTRVGRAFASIKGLGMSCTESIPERTLGRLESLYRETGVEPDNLQKIALKPGWIAPVGDRGKCGTALKVCRPR